METQLIVFYALAAVTVAAAAGVITRRNPVHSALFLVLAFFGVAGIYILLEAEFLAAVQILVYAGGIMVLFIFVIMLVDLEERGRSPRALGPFRTRHFVTSLLLTAIVVAMLLGAYAAAGFDEGAGDSAILRASGGNIETVAVALFRYYVLPFELASVLLLVAIVGVIVLAKKNI